MDNLLSIGKFARLCNTTTDTLIHYDNVGLLSPAHITETHRRLYDSRQHYRFTIIQLLAETGMPLNDIKELMKCDSFSSFSSALKIKEQQQRAQLHYLQNAIMYIDDMNTFTSLAQREQHGKIFIYRQPERQNMFATLIEPWPSDTDAFIDALQSHKNNCKENNIYPFPLGCIIPQKSPYMQKERLFLCYSPLHAGSPDNQTPVQPEGEYAVFLHKGSLDKLNESIHLLCDYIKEHEYMIAGDTYITFYDNSLVELQDSLTLIKIHIVKNCFPFNQQPWTMLPF